MIELLIYTLCLLIGVICGWKLMDNDEDFGRFIIGCSFIPVVNMLIVMCATLFIFIICVSYPFVYLKRK